MTATAPGGSPGTAADPSGRRLFLLQAVVIALLLTLFGRLYFLQIASGGASAAVAVATRDKQVITEAKRGVIVDDTGEKLVDNEAAVVVTVSRTTLDSLKPAAREDVLNRLGGLLLIAPSDIAKDIEPCVTKVVNKNVKLNPPPTCNPGSPYQPVALATYYESGPKKTNPDTLLSIEMQIKEHPLDYPGVSVGTQAVRSYPVAGAIPGTTLAAQTLGHLGPIDANDFDQKTATKPAGPYVGELNLLTTTEVGPHNSITTTPKQEDVGRGGLEQQYDAKLRGLDGDQTLTVNSAGDIDGTLSQTLPLQGDDLVLNLNDKIQAAAEKALQDGLNLAREYPSPGDTLAATQGAAAVVMTTDGRVVALASTPSFDETAYQSNKTYLQLSNDKTTPLNNRATAGIYPPGSSFKPITSSAVLADGIASVGEGLSCPTTIAIGNSTLHNFEGSALSSGDIQTLLEESCDTYFAGVGAQQWIDDGGYRDTKALQAIPDHEYLAKMALAYGFGKSVGVDLPEGSPGAVVDRAVQKANFAQLKKDYCAGAARRPKGTQLQEDDEDACKSDGAYREGDAAYFAIGQGSLLEVTPLQMARAYAAIANGGTLYAPTVGKALLRPSGAIDQLITPKKIASVPVPEEDLTAIRQGMFEVTHGSSGTAANTFAKYPVPVCGKTGTAEVQSVDANGNAQVPSDTSWFGSFAPCSADGSAVKNGYVVMVVIPHGGQGAQVAAPVVAEIDDAIFKVTGSKVGSLQGPTNSELPCFKPDGLITAPSKSCPHPQAAPLAKEQMLAPVTPASAPPGLLQSPAADVPSRRPSTKASPAKATPTKVKP